MFVFCVYCLLSSPSPPSQLHPCSMRPLFFLCVSLSFSLTLPVIRVAVTGALPLLQEVVSATGGWSREGKKEGRD